MLDSENFEDDLYAADEILYNPNEY